MLAVFVKNARITSKWHYSVKKNHRDSNFYSNCLLKSTLYDVYVVFSKKNRGDPGSASNNQIFKKKNAWALSKHEMRQRLAPNFTSSFS